MKNLIFLLMTLLLATVAHAESAWNVNGYTISYVNTLQHGQEVQVSGRVTSGQARSPLLINLFIANDEGRIYTVQAVIRNYVGKGELFETEFLARKRARWWTVKRIEIAGTAQASYNKNDVLRTALNDAIRASRGAQETEYQQINRQNCSWSTQPKKEHYKGKTSDVLFSSLTRVAITLRDEKTKKILFIKNISPHVLENCKIPYGAYVATIIGDGYKREKQFTINEEETVIDLN